MRHISWYVVVLTALLATVAGISSAQWYQQNSGTIRHLNQDMNREQVSTDSTILVKRIDHIAAYYNSIEEVDSMQKLFNGILGLPQWFSPAIRDVVSPPNQRFYNTGVYLGNVFLEFITFNIDTQNPTPPTFTPYFHAFAFANEITNTAAMLDSRGIPRSQVSHYSFRESSGTILTLFSNVTLSNFYNVDLLVFFCQYHPELFDCQSFDFGGLPAIADPDSQHVYFGNVVQNINGGPLALRKVESIVLASNNFETDRQGLSALFFPTEEDEPGKWSLPSGPSLVLQSSQTATRLATVNIAVDSLQAAKEFLIANGLGVKEREDFLKLDLSANIGVDIVLSDITTSIDGQINTPDAFILEQNYPNPFNPTTTIVYELPKSSTVRLSVYDILGREVSLLVNERRDAGVHEAQFNAQGLSSGVYFYRMQAGDFTQTRKLLLTK